MGWGHHSCLPLPAGHSCGEAGQLNAVCFHEGAERRETALRGTQNVTLGWLGRTGSTEHLIPPPINCGNRPTGVPRQPNQKDFSTRPQFPGLGFSQFPQVSATSNTREDLTSQRPPPGQQQPGWLREELPRPNSVIISPPSWHQKGKTGKKRARWGESIMV